MVEDYEEVYSVAKDLRFPQDMSAIRSVRAQSWRGVSGV